MAEGSNRSRDMDGATTRPRDPFEARLNEAAVAFAAIYGRSMREAGFGRGDLEFGELRRADDGLLEGRRQLMTTAVARDLQWGERRRSMDGVIERRGSPSAPVRRGDASVGKFADLD